jgi:hypothetical protein
MQDARIKWLAAGAVVAAVATACSGGGHEARGTKVGTDAEPAASVRRASPSTSTTSVPPVTIPVVASTTGTTAAPSAPVSLRPPPPVVSVSVAAMQGGSITRSDGAACSNISSQTLAQGRLELRRTGSTAAPLTVRYSTAGADGDFTPLPGAVTIPAGAASATVDVTPTMTFGPAPQHIHRSSSVAFAVLDDPAYDLAAPATAAVTLTFDVDVFGCDTPTA